MDGFPSIKGAKLTNKNIKILSKEFNWSMFTVGKTKTSITPSGGIHFSGKLTITEAVSMEIRKGGVYIIISLFEYPKGVVFHSHIYFPHIDKKSKSDFSKIIQEIYVQVSKILKE